MAPRLRPCSLTAGVLVAGLLAAGCASHNDKAVLAHLPTCGKVFASSCEGATIATTDVELRAALRFWGYPEDAVAMPADSSVLIVGSGTGSDCEVVLNEVRLDDSSGGLVVHVTQDGNGRCQTTDFEPLSFVIRVASTRPVSGVTKNGRAVRLVAPGG